MLIMTLVGVFCVLQGLRDIYPPLALIVAGCTLLAAMWFTEIE